MSFSYVIGIDEVGRGPLAGPVTVCAFALPYSLYGNGYRELRKLVGKTGFKLMQDSKSVKAKEREMGSDILYRLHKMKFHNIFMAISSKSAKDIDKYGISFCLHKLIASTLNKLKKDINFLENEVLVLLDGSLKAPQAFINQKTIIKGDAKEKVISCASVLAKVHRDKFMIKLAQKNSVYSIYSFDIHKGYGTLKHREAIQKHGLSDLHRHSFCKSIV